MLTVITGPMFSGKSAELIRRVNRLRVGGKKVQIFKYLADSRYAPNDKVASFDGFFIDGQAATYSHEVVSLLDLSNEVFVFDEVQFFDGAILAVLSTLIDLGKEVIVAGLNLDFRGEPFQFADSHLSFGDLLVKADYIVKLSAICTYSHDAVKCGKDASRTQRLIGGVPAPYHNPIVMLGSSESYEARCVAHHVVPGKPFAHFYARQQTQQNFAVLFPTE
jgi:thymidine kinase